MCTLRVSLIGIHMMSVDSLHINRWLRGDNAQHIVPTMMLLLHAHAYPVLCACARVFLILKQSDGHLLISLFQKKSTKAFQVHEQGFPNSCHRVPTQRGAATTKQNQLCSDATAAERCTKKKIIIITLLFPPTLIFSQIYF